VHISFVIDAPKSDSLMKPLLVVRDLCKSFDHNPVLRGVSFELRRGERLSLTGPSGSGKSTLLSCISTVDRPDSGGILFEGVAFESLSSNELTNFRRRNLGTIFQFFHLLPTLTAAENIELPLQLNNVDRRDRRERVRFLLERVQMSSRADAHPHELSGGEMQRVAIARAVAHGPQLVLADEPTGNLDSHNGALVLRLLQEISEETHTSLLLVSHSATATRICERRIHLLDGKLSERAPDLDAEDEA
jgi:putative ABC transport system ATP-binding protein